MDKRARGAFEYASDRNVVCVTWKDNAVVTMGSNWETITPLAMATRHKKGGSVSSEQPRMVKNYNAFMGGVDLTDRHVANLRTSIRKTVWYWPVVKHSFELLRVAAYVLYK